MIERFYRELEPKGVISKRRQEQMLDWLADLVGEGLRRRFYDDPRVQGTNAQIAAGIDELRTDAGPRSGDFTCGHDGCAKTVKPAILKGRGMIQKIDHLGIAVRSLDEAVPYYEKALGLKCDHREEVPSQKVRTAFFKVGEVHIELLEPTGPESPIAKYLEKNPPVGSITLRSVRIM